MLPYKWLYTNDVWRHTSLCRDNLNGPEEEIIDLQKIGKLTFQGWSWTQRKLITHFGLMSME